MVSFSFDSCGHTRMPTVRNLFSRVISLEQIMIFSRSHAHDGQDLRMPDVEEMEDKLIKPTLVPFPSSFSSLFTTAEAWSGSFHSQPTVGEEISTGGIEALASSSSSFLHRLLPLDLDQFSFCPQPDLSALPERLLLPERFLLPVPTTRLLAGRDATCHRIARMRSCYLPPDFAAMAGGVVAIGTASSHWGFIVGKSYAYGYFSYFLESILVLVFPYFIIIREFDCR